MSKRWGYTALDGESRRALLRTYREMANLLARRGLPQRASVQAPQEYARIISSSISQGMGAVQWLTEAASAAAYDPGPVTDATVMEAGEKLSALKRSLKLRARASA